MQTFGSLLRSILRVGFQRGSLERVQLQAFTAPLALAAAVLGLALYLSLALRLHFAQIAVAVFLFIGLLVPAAALLSRSLPRRRLLGLLTVLLWLLALGGGVAALLALLLPAAHPAAAAVLLLPIGYGQAQALATARRQHWFAGLAWLLAFAALGYGLYGLLDHQLTILFA
ncbi:MAG: hypothetical protein AAGI15_09575 [Pseudomonadota bacterium]